MRWRAMPYPSGIVMVMASASERLFTVRNRSGRALGEATDQRQGRVAPRWLRADGAVGFRPGGFPPVRVFPSLDGNPGALITRASRGLTAARESRLNTAGRKPLLADLGGSDGTDQGVAPAATHPSRPGARAVEHLGRSHP